MADTVVLVENSSKSLTIDGVATNTISINDPSSTLTIVKDTTSSIVTLGMQGPSGPEGKSAYQSAVDDGYTGTEQEWVATFTKGETGDSAYAVAVSLGYADTEANWLLSLKGDTGADSTVAGPKGDTGTTGDQGQAGKSAYTIAVEGGYADTEANWLLSLVATAEEPTYTNTETTPTSIGGISSGSTFDTKTLQEMLDLLLYPYQPPSFSSFSLSGNPGTLEVGQTFTGGLNTFNWGTNNSVNVNANSLYMTSTSGGTVITGLANDGSESIDIGTNITKTGLYTETWRMYGVSTETSTFSRSTSLNWRWKVYYGESENLTLDGTEIQSLTSNTFKSSRNGTYYVATVGYKFVAWPTIFGTLSTITDPDSNNAPIAVNTEEIVQVVNQYGVTQDYYLYRTTNYLNGSLTMVVN
jgi:hypothetical protein